MKFFLTKYAHYIKLPFRERIIKVVDVFISICIVIPIVEEYIFKHLIYKNFIDNRTIVSVLFSLAHIISYMKFRIYSIIMQCTTTFLISEIIFMNCNTLNSYIFYHCLYNFLGCIFARIICNFNYKEEKIEIKEEKIEIKHDKRCVFNFGKSKSHFDLCKYNKLVDPIYKFRYLDENDVKISSFNNRKLYDEYIF